MRPALLRELTDLYVQKSSHTPDEERLFTELVLRLIDHVDAADRAWLGARLAGYPAAPLAVIQKLAAPAITSRASSSPVLADLGANKLPHIQNLPDDESLCDTFFNATSEARRLILLHLGYSPIAPAPVWPPADPVTRLQQAALSRQTEVLAVTLQDLLSIPSACARRIADDDSGEAMLAALKALAVPSPALQGLLLFLNPKLSQPVETYFALVRLYDEITESAARRLVTIWRMSETMSSHGTTHQTQLIEDRPTRARTFASHEAHLMPPRSLASDHARRRQNKFKS